MKSCLMCHGYCCHEFKAAVLTLIRPAQDQVSQNSRVNEGGMCSLGPLPYCGVIGS